MTKVQIFISIIFLMSLFSFTQGKKKKIMVIGDSISLGYGPNLKVMLESDFEYSTKNTNADAGNLDFPTGPNAGDSRMMLTYLRTLKNERNFHTDLMLLNCGLHDIKVDVKNNKIVIKPNEYKNNLDSIFDVLQAMKIRFIWVNSTPVNDSIHNSKRLAFNRYNEDLLTCNCIADSICTKRNIPFIDLFGFTSTFPISAYMDHVHYKAEYAKLQAAYIAGYVRGNFKSKN